MTIFDSINKNDISKKIRHIEKAYSEGIYNDSPLNRKLGRVGMSYTKYAEMVAAGEKEKAPSYNKDYIVNEIPENIADLKFREGRNGHQIANYTVGTKEVFIEMVINGRDDRIYSMTIKEGNDSKRITELSTKEVTRKMKDLKRIDDGIPLYEKIPLTPEELDAKWGDIGFNYTFYKDNLDIKVWIHEDSDKKNPRLNLYVIDRDSNKRKSKTNLTLSQIHDELLRYELNPKIDAELTKEQLKEFNRLKNERELGKDYKNSENYISPLLKEFDILDKKGEIKRTTVKIENNNIEIIPTGNYVSLSVSRGIQDNVITVKNNKHDLSLELDKIEEEGDNYSLLGKDAIQPSKKLDVDFNKNGIAYFQDNNSVTEYRVNPKDNSQIDIIVYNKNGGLIGVDSTSVDNFNQKVKNLNLNIDKDKQQKYPSNFLATNNGVAAKDLIENYSSPETLMTIPNIIYSKENFNVEDFNQELGRKKLVENKWNRGKREAYAWIKSGAAKKWLRDLPQSNKDNVTKEIIYEKLKSEAERLSPSGNKFQNGVSEAKREIIKEFY